MVTSRTLADLVRRDKRRNRRQDRSGECSGNALRWCPSRSSGGVDRIATWQRTPNMHAIRHSAKRLSAVPAVVESASEAMLAMEYEGGRGSLSPAASYGSVQMGQVALPQEIETLVQHYVQRSSPWKLPISLDAIASRRRQNPTEAKCARSVCALASHCCRTQGGRRTSGPAGRSQTQEEFAAV
jgi:hypothetical protein